MVPSISPVPVTPRSELARAEQVDKSSVTPQPLSMRHVVAAVVVGLLALGLALLVDWVFFQSADHDVWADVVRSTVLALGLLGAVPAGYVAYRRQRTTEAVHEHEQSKEKQRQAELVDANVRSAAKDYRDRYTAAATQIGSDKAPIRLAGVYALAQLADEWGRSEPDQRQTCIDVLCSYLRMPWAAQTIRRRCGTGEARQETSPGRGNPSPGDHPASHRHPPPRRKRRKRLAPERLRLGPVLPKLSPAAR
jgi:hypothetical protein